MAARFKSGPARLYPWPSMGSAQPVKPARIANSILNHEIHILSDICANILKLVARYILFPNNYDTKKSRQRRCPLWRSQYKLKGQMTSELKKKKKKQEFLRLPPNSKQVLILSSLSNWIIDFF